jgi:hypothetical protein
MCWITFTPRKMEIKYRSGFDFVTSEGQERRKTEKCSHDPYITRAHNLTYKIL